MGLGPTLGRIPWHEKLRRVLARRRGARLGEAAVVSRQIHTGAPETPHLITILSYLDAGNVMYGRPDPGEIIHIDVFHDVADVDHRRVAEAVRRVLAGVRTAENAEEGRELADYFDLCTGTGAGRVTGDLTGGGASVQAAHRQHVHLAGRLPDCQLEHLAALVGAVEEEVQAQGVELRRIEKLRHMTNPEGMPTMDLSNYRGVRDSLNQGQQAPSSGGRAGQSASPTEGQSLRSGRSQPGAGGGEGQGRDCAGSGQAGTDWAEGAGDEGAAYALPGESAHAGGTTQASATAQSGWDVLEDERRLQAALELSRRLGSPDEVKRVLDELSREQGWASLYGSGSSQAPFVIKQLEEEGLVRRDLRGLRLTDSGRELAAYLDRHLRDVKLRFRKLIRRMPASVPGSRADRRPGQQTQAPPSPDVRYGVIRGTAPAEAGAWLGDVAVPETVRSALIRTQLEQIRSSEARRPGLRLSRSDVHVYLRSGDQPLNICLLIDASASMAGRRILAAKHLARHLLVSTRDRIAVIAFQERDVRVHVPFTRDYGQVEDGLARIQPMGLTPLAHGLTQSLDLIRASRIRRPLLLLITDGIPTVPKWTIDPLADALEAARQVGAGRIPFGCIGLQPSKRYLDELVRTAGGTLHVVEELDEEALVIIAHRERQKLALKAR